MTEYIITFFTHYEAIRCSRNLKCSDIRYRLAPVPRALSSSCGTCISFHSEKDPFSLINSEFEQLYKRIDNEYLLLKDNRRQ